MTTKLEELKAAAYRAAVAADAAYTWVAHTLLLMLIIMCYIYVPLVLLVIIVLF